MKLGGFALKKGKKKALGASAGFSASIPVAARAPEKVFVTDFDPSAPAELTADGKQPLVIPLVETNAWNEAPKAPDREGNGDKKVKSGDDVSTAPETSADEQAAAQILAETQETKTPKQQQELVIPVAGERDKKRAQLFQDGENRPKSDQKKRPILQQNAVPGLDELQDVTDKYRHDVALRPDAPDVHSDVYESVPVEAFGAALLRGMGWTGDVDPEDMGVAPQPRHKLLGLGATKRPGLPGEDKKKRRRKRKGDDKDKDQDKRSGLNTGDKPREDWREDKERRTSSRRSSRSADRDRRRRSLSRSPGCSDRRKRSRSRSRDRDRGRDRGRGRDRDRDNGRDRSRDRDRDRDRRSRSRGRSDRHSRRR